MLPLALIRKQGSKVNAELKRLLARLSAEVRRAGVVRQAVDRYHERKVTSYVLEPFPSEFLQPPSQEKSQLTPRPQVVPPL